MKMIRSALVAIGLGALAAGAIRLRGARAPQPRSGGWRELTAPGFD